LPFSDHCDALVGDAAELAVLCGGLASEQRDHGWRYAEIRPRSALSSPPGFEESDRFFLHVLDLRPGPAALFAAFHKDSVQRKIRRAERDGVTCEEGRSEALLRQ